MNKDDKKYVGVGDFKSTPKIEEYVFNVLKTGRLSYGPYLSGFEKELSRIHGTTFGVMSNSGTSSLQIALQALKINHGWKDGDEVIVPATTFVATANIVIHNNMRPIFVDIEPDYYGINPKLIQEKISDKTRCIIPAHLFGMPCQMDEIMDIATRYDLKVIEDSCETMFASFNEKRVGGFGDIACFSTYIAHILVTGVGGISITSVPEYAIIMRSLVNHGRDSIYLNVDDDKGKTSEQMKEIIERRFSFVHLGHSFRITELEGAIGLAQLEEWEENIRKRQANANYLTKNLSEFNEHLQLPKIRPGATHSFMMYPIVLINEGKERLCNYLESLGVETRDMLPLINQPFYMKEFNLKAADYPVSAMILDRGFYVGCHPYTTPMLMDHIVQCFRNYFEKKVPTEPAKVALILITSDSPVVSQSIFSRIDLSGFESIIICDVYPEKKIGDRFRQMGYDVIDVPKKSVLQVYKSALEKVREEYLVFFSLDGGQDPEELVNMSSYLKLGYDLVIASRFIVGGRRYDADALIPYRGVGNRMITMMLNLAFDSNIADSFQPFRGVSLDFLRSASLDSKLLTNYQMTIRAVTMKRKIFEIPSVEQDAITRLGIMKALWAGLMTIPLIIREKIVMFLSKSNKDHSDSEPL